MKRIIMNDVDKPLNDIFEEETLGLQGVIVSGEVLVLQLAVF